MSELRYGLQSMQSETLQNWIEAQMMRGRYTFNKEDITGLGVHNNKDSLNRALYRDIVRKYGAENWDYPDVKCPRCL